MRDLPQTRQERLKVGVEIDAQGEQMRFQQGLSRRQRRAAEYPDLRVVGKGMSDVLLAIGADPDSQSALGKKRQEPLPHTSNHQLDAILLTDELLQDLGNEGA
ncbi:hypothetical protein C1Y31_17310 [Pseudomonas sp. FW305-25]|nr:hypothetical protein C1Y31_17310 [Pseudomonas sp. FW305-25]PMY68294.1 hypothetical protein C1Y32_18310 [Pseudomonas sp. FW126-L8]PNA72523.1 hypothetical protein C1Y33_28220 [Pseudomonas sp. FW305-76]